jgi:hypothetical protein
MRVGSAKNKSGERLSIKEENVVSAHMIKRKNVWTFII